MGKVTKTIVYLIEATNFSPITLSALNVFLTSLCVFIVVILCRYIWRNKSVRRLTGVRLAIAILIYVFGDLIIRAWTGIWRLGNLHHHSVAWMSTVPMLPVGTAFSTVGALFFIREFSPRWHPWTWFIVALACACSTTALLLLW